MTRRKNREMIELITIKSRRLTWNLIRNIVHLTGLNQQPMNFFLIFLFLYLFVLQLHAVWPFTIDDMYISLRYAKNWAAGAGLVWNIGADPVEGYSNFSFVVLARWALVYGYDPVLVLKWAGVFGLFFTCMAIYGITRMWFVTRMALIPCFWLLTYKGQILWSVSGLETTVYQALLCSAVFFIFRGLGYEKFPLKKQHIRPSAFITAGILLALAGMTRPEAPVFMGLFGLLLIFNASRKSNRLHLPYVFLFFCSFFICFIPYFFWRWHYYGRLFPNPVYCKGLTSILPFTLDKKYLHLIWPFFLLIIPVLLGRKSNKVDIRSHFLWLPSVVYLILLISAEPLVAFDNRLFLPAFVLLLPLSLQGIRKLLKSYSLEAIYLASFLLAFFFIPMMSLSNYHHFTENPIAGEHLRHRVAAWLQQHVSPGSRVVLADSGLIPYKGPYHFIDSYCLNNAEMTKKLNISMYQWVCKNALETKPDVIILTSLTEDGRRNYTPADACLAVKLINNLDYGMQASLKTGTEKSYYHYEIFKLKKR